MSDHPALVHFYQGWADNGEISKDGLPVYVDTVMIQIERPPLLKLDRPASQGDFRAHPEEYEAYQRQQRARDLQVGDSGYPLVYWPAVTAAEVEMLSVRGIYTVEQLEKQAGNRDLPGNLAELALRAERLMDMQKQFGKYEVMLKDREDQLAETLEQLAESRKSLSAANALIETLKMKVA